MGDHHLHDYEPVDSSSFGYCSRLVTASTGVFSYSGMEREMIFILILLVHSWYPLQCCNEADCHPVPCDEIGVWPEWTYYKGKRLLTSLNKPSLDGQCHACFSDDRLRCIFLPEKLS